jgi:hypothetical protein
MASPVVVREFTPLADQPGDSKREKISNLLKEVYQTASNGSTMFHPEGETWAVASDAVYAARPINIITAAIAANPTAEPPVLAAAAVIAPRPSNIVPDRPQGNASAAAMTLWVAGRDDARHVGEIRSAYKNGILKAIGPDIAREIVDDPDLGTAGMSAIDILQRLSTRFGELTSAEVSAITASLQTPITTDFRTHINATLIKHNQLAKCGQAVAENSKVCCYVESTRGHPGIATAITRFNELHTVLGERSFAALRAYLLDQEANITNCVGTADAGFGSALASNASANAGRGAPPASPLETALLAEVASLKLQLEHLTKDRAKAQNKPAQLRKDRPYCFLHGSKAHWSSDCRDMAADKAKYTNGELTAKAPGQVPGGHN